MKCLALLSGGKDSVAAIDVANQHGWEVVAALRLLPAEDDAWMFHTPNLGVVEGIAEALGIPLLSAATRPDPEQEVEDLESAIAQAKESHGIEAIISGALASDYQKTRIDRIGHRLGLKTFAPLWHKNRRSYLDGLFAAGYDIRFSRVAADGLTEDWAGGALNPDAVSKMEAMSSRPDIAGEGGEFETLVLDAPSFRRRIVVDEYRVDASASRATWHVTKWHLENKDA